MWIFLWFILSSIILGIFAWSLRILFQQKKAWGAFAKRMGLTYVPGKIMQSPSITGRIKNFKISLYTTFQKTNDVRGQRFVTVIELEMGPGMPTAAVIATEEYQGFVETLKMDETLVPDFKDWSSSYLIRTKSRDKLAAYLTPERLELIHSLFSMSNAFSLLFFDELECVLRIETTDPLRKPDNMEKITKRIIAIATKLWPTEEERSGIAATISPAAIVQPGIVLDVPVNSGLTLELEEEGADVPSEPQADTNKP